MYNFAYNSGNLSEPENVRFSYGKHTVLKEGPGREGRKSKMVFFLRKNDGFREGNQKSYFFQGKTKVLARVRDIGQWMGMGKGAPPGIEPGSPAIQRQDP